MSQKFKCKVIAPNGQVMEKEVTAESIAEARAALMQGGEKPIEIHPFKKGEKGSDKGEIQLFKKKVRAKDLSLFCRQMNTMLKAGMPLIKALVVMQEQLEHKVLREVTREMLQSVQKGFGFSYAMKMHPTVFPPLLISMVETGEMTGTQDDVLHKMAEHYKKEDIIEKKIRGALVYPKFLSGLTVTVVVIMLTQIIPKFVDIFQSNGVELPWVTQFILNLSNGIVKYWYIILAVVLGSIFGFKAVLKTENGKRAWDRFLLRVPVVKGLTKKIATSRFTRTLSTLLTSGLPLLASLEMSGRVTGNTVVEDGIQEITEDIKKGSRLSVLIKRIIIFPPMLVSMISIGEESGALESMLEKTSDFYDDELEAALTQMVGLIEPVMIVVMGVVIGFIVVAMIWPMMNLFQAFQQ